MENSETEVAWIAGVGAPDGLGAAIARRYAKGGLVVALSGRTPSRLETIAAEINAGGGKAHVIVGDLSVGDDVQAMSLAVTQLGQLRAAVFNASGAPADVPPLDITPEDFEKSWRGSAFAGFLFSKHVIYALLSNLANESRGHGSLIITGATASLRGSARYCSFSSAKSALRSLVQSLAREYNRQRIHIAHVVVDGQIDSERVRKSAPSGTTISHSDERLSADAIADSYWQLHMQHASAWTLEIDIRPCEEKF